MRTRLIHKQKGQALVESALTLVVLLALFIGVFDIGVILFVHQTLIDRARTAVRWGVVNAYDQTAVQNLVLYGATTPGNGQTPSFGLTAANVVVSRPAADVGLPEDRINVTVSYSFNFFTGAFVRGATAGGSALPPMNMLIQYSLPYEAVP
jgi:Flp pilus assembly protein TadG